MTDWNVKENFCSDGVMYSSFAPRVYHIDPSVRVETSRELTEDERRRVIDAIVKAASVEMININEREITNSQCSRCARRAGCGKTFTPQIDYGECGHCDGCADYESKKEAK